MGGGRRGVHAAWLSEQTRGTRQLQDEQPAAGGGRQLAIASEQRARGPSKTSGAVAR